MNRVFNQMLKFSMYEELYEVIIVLNEEMIKSISKFSKCVFSYFSRRAGWYVKDLDFS